MTLSRLKQPKEVGAQLRMYAQEAMPTSSVRGPLEKVLVKDIRDALEKMGYKTWSGRIRIFGRPLDGSEGLPFVPILGPGTPDILGVYPPMSPAHGRMFGLEAKRDLCEEERVSQQQWRMMAAAWRIGVEVVRSVDHAVQWVEERRHLAFHER